MARKSEKPALIEKCDELGIEYKSTDSIADLKGKIADKLINPEVAEVVVETEPEAPAPEDNAPVDSVEPEVSEESEPKKAKFIKGKFVENAPVISVTQNGEYLDVRTTVATYKLTEAEYEKL